MFWGTIASLIISTIIFILIRSVYLLLFFLIIFFPCLFPSSLFFSFPFLSYFSSVSFFLSFISFLISDAQLVIRHIPISFRIATFSWWPHVSISLDGGARIKVWYTLLKSQTDWKAREVRPASWNDLNTWPKTKRTKVIDTSNVIIC